MSGRTIRMLITWGVFSVGAWLLCEAIIEISVELGKAYHGRLSELLGWMKGFFFLMPLIFARGLALAAPIAFCAEGLFAARLEDRRRYRAVLVASLGYIGLAVVMMCVYLLVTLVLEPEISITDGNYLKFMMAMLLSMPLFLLYPLFAVSIFAFWVPVVATGLYCRLSKHPRWWLAGLLGTLTLLGGVLFCSLMGVLVGAATD